MLSLGRLLIKDGRIRPVSGYPASVEQRSEAGRTATARSES